jgi:hypothetical protein
MPSSRARNLVNTLIPVVNVIGAAMFTYGTLWFIDASIKQNAITLDASMCSMSTMCRASISEKIEIATDLGRLLQSHLKVAAIGAGLACLRIGKG